MNALTIAAVGVAALIGARVLAPKAPPPHHDDPQSTDPGQIGGGAFARPVLGNQAAIFWNRYLPGGPTPQGAGCG